MIPIQTIFNPFIPELSSCNIKLFYIKESLWSKILRSAIVKIYSFICKSYEFCLISTYFENSSFYHLFNNITFFHATLSIH